MAKPKSSKSPRASKKTPRPGARRGPLTWLRRTFSHRRLITAEALLVAGLLDRMGRQWIINDSPFEPWLRILILMLMVVGVFGGIIIFVERIAGGGLSKAHEVVQALPLPTPLIFVHVAIFAGLFFLYALVTGLEPFPGWVKLHG